MKTAKTIESVSSTNLCAGCATCAGICPQSAISVKRDREKFVFPVDRDKCNGCGLCYEACPGVEVDFNKLNLEIFGTAANDIWIGNNINCYSGYSLDENIRYNSTSGGIVSSLLIYALESGLIDGALVTGADKENPFNTTPYIARTREDILRASGSKYCLSATNEALKTILAEEGRFAVVGLPCHIHGIRKAQNKIKKLKSKIVFQVGLFCGQSKIFKQTEIILGKNNLRLEDISQVKYRAGGWPGIMRITTKDGREIWEKDYFLNYFEPIRCSLCCDLFAELSDISCGDAWLDEFRGDKTGTNLIIARNKIGDDLLKSAEGAGKIKLAASTAEKVLQSNKGITIFKKKVNARIKTLSLLNEKPPVYKHQLPSISYTDYIGSASYYIKRKIVNLMPLGLYQGMKVLKKKLKK